MAEPDRTQRASLRKQLRRSRRSLSADERALKTRLLFQRAVALPLFTRSARLAFYFASDGEIDPLTIMLRALQMGKHCHLPVLSAHRPDKVSFAPFHPGNRLRPNRWGIPEPDAAVSQLARPFSLDLVFVPLVGFDRNCNRLGMGKGFYDRTFAYRLRTDLQRPRLVGLAFEAQKVDSIPLGPWDVPLDAVITEAACYSRR